MTLHLEQSSSSKTAGADASGSFVKLRGLSKSYDGVTPVVRDLNLEIDRGEFLTMLGPSGSGKTTVLMMLAGFESPDRGQILIEGKQVTELPPRRRGIGVVFQNYALFPHMTIAQNVAFPLECRNVPKHEIALRVKRALETVQLGKMAARRPNQLSGGQQQRVALARSIVFEPKLILMDEPLGALDRQLRETMQFEIKRLHEELGLTVVYVTHDQGEALAMSDRVAVFDKGNILQLAKPSDLYEHPATTFVAGFVGESNRISGRLVSIEGSVGLVELMNGKPIRAQIFGHREAGDQVTIVVRPERIQFRPVIDGRFNVLEAHVLERTYMGDHTRIRLRACGSDDFVVKVANTHDASQILVGLNLSIGWRPEDCRALDAESGKAA